MFNTGVQCQLTVCTFALPPVICATSYEFALPPWLKKLFNECKPPTMHSQCIIMDQSLQENRYHLCSI